MLGGRGNPRRLCHCEERNGPCESREAIPSCHCERERSNLHPPVIASVSEAISFIFLVSLGMTDRSVILRSPEARRISICDTGGC